MNFTKPKKFKYNSVIIGAGSAGLVTSYIGSLLKAKVALIEKHKMGGDCLNTGCIPSKALIKTSKIFGFAKNPAKYGLKNINIDYEFADIMNRVQKVIKKIEPHDSVERYEKLGVECLQGHAEIKSPWEVEVNGISLTTKSIIIATGAKPLIPKFDGLNEVNYVTSDSIWKIKKLPEKLIVLGGGSIGCELAQCFARFGSKVTMIERLPRIMSREDEEVSQVIEKRFNEDGINLMTRTTAEKFYTKENKHYLTASQKNDQNTKTQIIDIEFDLVIIALGRKANTENIGVDNLGLELNSDGTLKVDKYLRTTKYKNIFACGDVAGPFQFTHMAAHQAWYTSINSLFQPFKKFKVDYSVVPWATFTDPEVATVGLTETEIKNTNKYKNLNYESTIYNLENNDRAIADSEDHGFVKVITKKGSDQILGATIVAPNASDMVIEFISAMKNKYGLNRIMSTTHPYPSYTDSNKFVASMWKQKNKPDWIFKYLDLFHKWRRN